jgi:hypothetical protein
MTNHITPEPWTLHLRPFIKGHPDKHIITDASGYHIAWVDNCVCPAFEKSGEANARLIVSAPKLLQSLIECVEEVQAFSVIAQSGKAELMATAKRALAVIAEATTEPNLCDPLATLAP